MSQQWSPQRAKREAAKRRRQEKRWAKKSGPVTVRFVCPICGGPHSRAEHDGQVQTVLLPLSRSQVREVGCIACGAKPGENCIRADGRRRTANHMERVHTATRKALFPAEATA